MRHLALFAVFLTVVGPLPGQPARPNVIVILTDDLGYGDLGCYGSPTVRTPHLDRMAAEGMKLTDFYAMPSCSPSRAALLTGCYPPRVGIPDVVGPRGPAWTADKQYGLHPTETTLAEMLKAAGYATGMTGKWHLGHFPETMPTRHGFDEFLGLPYSNDMISEGGKKNYPPLALLNGTDTVETDPDQQFLTERYTDFAIDFIERHRDTSFFLYIAHSMPHVPLFASPGFAGASGRGLLPDVIQEIDASVGDIFLTLRQQGLDTNTLVIFTSDNGPWLTYGNHAGSAGPFREGKGTTWEGGTRVPAIVRWPAGIPGGGVVGTPLGLFDVLPTVAEITGAELPARKLDGVDFSFLLRKGWAIEERPVYFYRSGKVEAVRLGPWKLHLPHFYRTVSRIGNDGRGGDYDYTAETGLELYHLYDDPGERYDRAAEEPEIVIKLEALATAAQAEMDENKRPALYPE